MSIRCRPATLRTSVRPIRRSGLATSRGDTWPCSSRAGRSRATSPFSAVNPWCTGSSAVAHTPWRGMGEQNVDAAAVPHPAPPGRAAQGPGSPGLLAVGVLVGPAVVGAAATKAGHPQAGHVGDAAVGAHRPVGPRCPHREPGPQREPGPGNAVTGQVRVMVSGHEHERHVQRVHQVLEVVEGQVPAGENQFGPARQAHVGAQSFVGLIGYGEDTNHVSMVCENRGGAAAALSAAPPAGHQAHAPAGPTRPGKFRPGKRWRPAAG